MARFAPHHRFFSLKIPLGIAALAGLACAVPAAFAQHGGGHAGGGGGHFGGGAHASAPHVSAPPAPHFEAPVRIPGPPAMGAGTRNFVAVPPAVHLIPPLGSPRPVMGNRLSSPILPPAHITPTPRVTIGFPPLGQIGAQAVAPGARGLSFSGDGREIWQDSAGAAESTMRVGPGDRDQIHIHPRAPGPIRPIRPIFPIFGPVFRGPFFGGPFFGLGFSAGWGFNSFWGPTCGPYWSWGFGCNTLPFYGYGYGNLGYGGTYDGNYGNASSTDNAGGQVENEANAPYIFEYPRAPVYGGGERQLVQLYLKDGTVYEVTDYWLVNDKLHFTITDSNGQWTEFMIDFSELDLQKTVNVNTQRGFRFVLRNEPLQQYLDEQKDAPASQTQPRGQEPSAPQDQR
jgi:hypothetical protein